MGKVPPGDRRRSPRSGSGSLRLGTGGTFPVCSALSTTASSSPAPMAWPVKPLVLAMSTWLADAPKALRRLEISAAAEPPLAGVKVSWLMNTACRANSERVVLALSVASATSASISSEMWVGCSREPW